ncbi:MAG: hypothetical protein QXO32_05135 [Candidatus Bathyarchaeia archaeon]
MKARLTALILILTIIGFTSTVSATPTLQPWIHGFAVRVVYMQVGGVVNASTTTVEASIFTPNVTVVEVSATMTSVEAVYTPPQLESSKIASILIIAILVAFTVSVILRRRGGMPRSSKPLS